MVQKDCILEKYPGKGGWTYVAIPEIPQDKKAYFGWVRVRGSIDGFEFRSFNLMPMGNGCLFLSVRAEIRKVIKKQAGDTSYLMNGWNVWQRRKPLRTFLMNYRSLNKRSIQTGYIPQNLKKPKSAE